MHSTKSKIIEYLPDTSLGDACIVELSDVAVLAHFLWGIVADCVPVVGDP